MKEGRRLTGLAGLPVRPRYPVPLALFRIAALLSPLFLIPILILSLAFAEVIDLPNQITYERTLIANLVLYWILATALVGTLVHRRAVVSYLGSRRPQLALVLLTLVLSVAAAEITLRLLQPTYGLGRFQTLASSTLHHVNPPNTEGRGMGGVVVRTNESGFRSDHTLQGFLRHTTRIAVLGDSFAFGLGVSQEDTSTAVLERRLRSILQTDQIAVINTGVVSHSPLLQRSLFRQVVRAYEPTLTLLLLDVSDIGDDLQYSKEDIGDDPEGPRFGLVEGDTDPSFYEQLALWRATTPFRWRFGVPFEILSSFLPERIRGYDYYRFSIEVGGVEELNRFFILRHPLEQTLPHFERTLRYIQDIADSAHLVGSRFLLVITPRYFHWSAEECPDNWEVTEFQRYRLDEAYEFEYFRFFELAQERVDFPIVSLLPEFQTAENFPLVFRHDPHWNEAGNRLVGEALAAYLVEHDLLDGDAGLDSTGHGTGN